MTRLRLSGAAGWRRVVMVLTFMAAASFLFGYVELWVTDTVIDSRRFGEVTTSALTSEPVRDAVATAVVDRALEDYPLVQTIVRRPVEAAISGLLGTALFEEVLRSTASELHLLITIDARDQVVLRIGQAYQIIYGIVDVIDPTILERLPPPEALSEVVILTKETVAPVRVAARRTPFIAAGALLLGVGLFALSVFRAQRRLDVVRLTGLQLAFGSVLILIFVPISRIALTGGIERPLSRVVVDQAYRSLTSSLVTRTWLLLAFGLVLAGIGFVVAQRRRAALEGHEPRSIFSRGLSRLHSSSGRSPASPVPAPEPAREEGKTGVDNDVGTADVDVHVDKESPTDDEEGT